MRAGAPPSNRSEHQPSTIKRALVQNFVRRSLIMSAMSIVDLDSGKRELLNSKKAPSIGSLDLQKLARDKSLLHLHQVTGIPHMLVHDSPRGGRVAFAQRAHKAQLVRSTVFA